MACYGLSHPIVAKLGSTGYSDGFACGKAVNVSVTPNFTEASLFGDNELTEYVKAFKDADVVLGVTTLPSAALTVMFGHTIDTDTSEVEYGSQDNPGYCGFGFYTSEMVDGVAKYGAVWLPKCKFSESAESYTTKGDSITFQTPSLSGKALADADGNWKYGKSFTSEADALTWLKGKANITA